MNLPGFDSWVYVAMADYPAFFTAPPWGYRVLTPSLVHALPLRRARAFRYVTFTFLITAGGVIFLYLRRVGIGETASLLGVLGFGLSPPVRDCLDNPFLVEPLTFAVIATFLLAVEAGCGVAVLSFLAVLGTLSKEVMLLLLPVIWLARRRRQGDRRSLMETALVAVPVVVLILTLRLWWTPYVKPAIASSGTDYFQELFELVGSTWRVWLGSAFLGGLTPLAVLGACRAKARPFLGQHGYLLLVMVFVPFLNPLLYPFALPHLPKDYSRYMLYTLPAILHLCLLAIDRVWPTVEARPGPLRSGRLVRFLASCATLALVASPFVRADRYRRAEIRDRDGAFVRQFVRGSLRAAQRLEEGKAVVWELEVPDDNGRLRQPRVWRWFLREGWGYSRLALGDEVSMAASEAGFLLPCFSPRDIVVRLSLRAAHDTPLFVSVNGIPVEQVLVRREPQEYRFRIPASTLYRGDNAVTLAAKVEESSPFLWLRRIAIGRGDP